MQFINFNYGPTYPSKVFVPTYSGQEMKMLKLYDFDDYEKLPLTRWNIKQPNPDDERRENPMMTGDTDVTGFRSVYSILTARRSIFFMYRSIRLNPVARRGFHSQRRPHGSWNGLLRQIFAQIFQQVSRQQENQ
jgi:hypothetical protein